MCYDESGLCAQNVGTVLGSLVYTIERAYVISQGGREFFHEPPITNGSQIWFWNLKWQWQSLWFAIANWMKQFLSRSNGLWTWKCPQHTWIIIMDPVKFEAFVCTEFTMKVVLHHVAVVGILCSDLHKRPFCFTRIFCQTSSRWGQLNTTIYYWG